MGSLKTARESWQEGNPYDAVRLLVNSVNLDGDYQAYRDSLDGATEEQILIFAVVYYASEVNNGGHSQFFFNSSGLLWKDTLTGLERIGAQPYADVLASATRLFEGSEPKFDRNERVEQLNQISSADLNDLDDQFYDLGDDTLDQLLLEFVEEITEAFFED